MRFDSIITPVNVCYIFLSYNVLVRDWKKQKKSLLQKCFNGEIEKKKGFYNIFYSLTKLNVELKMKSLIFIINAI